MITEEQLAKLPRYARFEIDKLRKDLERARRKLSAGPENSNTFVEHGAQTDATPLGDSPLIRFELDNTYIEVRVQDGELQVRANGSYYPLIRPQSSNSFRIKVKDWLP